MTNLMKTVNGDSCDLARKSHRSPIRPLALVRSPVMAHGIAPTNSRPAMMRTGPKRSQKGPMIKRATVKIGECYFEKRDSGLTDGG